MYALGYNTTKKVCVANGQTDEEGKKFAKFDDIVAKVMISFTFIIAISMVLIWTIPNQSSLKTNQNYAFSTSQNIYFDPPP